MDPGEIKQALGKLSQEHDEIIIPEEVGINPRAIMTDGHPDIAKVNELSYNGRNRRNVSRKDIIYSNGISWKEVESRKGQRAYIRNVIGLIEGIRDIIKLYSSDLIPGVKGSEIKNKGKRFNPENEGKLIDSILDIVINGELKKYSLRELESFLKKTGFKIDYSTLGNKFKKEAFQLLLCAAIMRRKNLLKKKTEKGNLDSFNSWYEEHYLGSLKKKYKQTGRDEFIETNGDRKGGSSGTIDKDKYEDDFYKESGLN
jgi:hypothetical protein